ncbi:MAG: hypothetical protein KAR11_07245 [Phycisphaerae bacterium]|nr:hypothetical protein [Phycisphaerae bacterium]
MKRCLLLGFCAILVGVLSGCPITASQDTPVGHTTEKTLGDVGAKYYLYVPSTYSSDKPIPLVITLHGTNPYDTAWAQIRQWKALAEEKEFIVAVPLLSIFSTEGLLPVHRKYRMRDLKEDDKRILAVRKEVCEKYNIDKRNILLTGFSAGGYPMYYTGLSHPEKFSMLVGRSCNSEPLIFEQLEDIVAAKDYKRIPVWIFVGKDEPGWFRSQTWKAYEWLIRHGWEEKNCRMKHVDGGHLRRVRRTYDNWGRHRVK